MGISNDAAESLRRRPLFVDGVLYAQGKIDRDSRWTRATGLPLA